jgi:MFS family permease
MAHFSSAGQLLLRVSFLATFAENMLVPVYSAFTESVGGSVLDVGIAFAIFSIATGIVITVVGTRLGDARSVKKALVVGFLLSGLGSFFYLGVQTRMQLFGVQLLAGLAAGLIEPTWDALFTDALERPTIRHWSIWAGGVHFSVGLAALLGGVVVQYGSFAALFIAMGCLDILGAAVLFWSKVESPAS